MTDEEESALVDAACESPGVVAGSTDAESSKKLAPPPVRGAYCHGPSPVHTARSE
jgi:hypothetical protein